MGGHSRKYTVPIDRPFSLDLQSLGKLYRTGTVRPEAVIDRVYRQIEGYADPALWITLLPHEQVRASAQALAQSDPATLPLYGVPFAIKDNLDLAGVPTTAGCPEFAYLPERSATVVERLCAAGAIPVGKVNLDQFATGLVGVRSPYGVCRNPFDERYIAGGSSAGSAVTVAAGMVSFALGSDTAGSGRVPAAFNNLVGLKPSRGLVSTRGLVPAVRSLDCVSIFALTCADAATILQVGAAYDPADPFSRRPQVRPVPPIAGLRVGVPEPEALQFFGDTQAEQLYRQNLTRLEALGCRIVGIHFQDFAEAAHLLYGGPWVAERLAAVGGFIARHPEAVHPVVREIIAGAARYDAVSAYRATYALAELRRRVEAQWQAMDVLVLPTTGTIYTIAEVEAEPVALNSNLGFYTNFANLLDLCAVSVPGGFNDRGLPTGVSLFAPAFSETLLCRLGAALHAALPAATLGATGIALPPGPEPFADALPAAGDHVSIAVVGAHLSGQPLNYQLTELGGKLVRACRTAPCYRLYALTKEKIPKPGLLRQEEGDGFAIALEVWQLPVAGFGRFVANIPPPLGIGTLMLEDGELVKGFLCEAWAVRGEPDISHLGGWLAYLKS